MEVERINNKKNSKKNNKKTKGEKIVIVIVVCVLLIAIVCGGVVAYGILGFPNRVRTIEEVQFKPSRKAEGMLTPEEMKEDLDQLKKVLFSVHPITEGLDETNDTTGFTEAFEKAYKEVEEEMSIGAFYYCISEVMATIEDGHTIPMVVQGESYLKAELAWIGDKLYVVDSSFLQAYDEVITIGDVPISIIYENAQKYIAAENETAARRAFINRIGTPNFLQACGVEVTDLTITVERENEKVTEPFQTMGVPYAYDPLPYFVNYTIDEEKKLCHFIMKVCDYNEAYVQLLKDMFTEIKEKDVTTFVVDIRQNPGGNSMVSNELLRYMPVDSYKGYGSDIRYSEEASKQRGYFLKKGVQHFASSEVKNEQYTDLLFTGDTYVLIDDATFSSANWLGVTFQDTGAATIVGEPTSNNPNSYGDILSFQLPNSTIVYSVSHKKWVAANKDREKEDALIPDVIVWPTLEQLVNKEDVVMQWVHKEIESTH